MFGSGATIGMTRSSISRRPKDDPHNTAKASSRVFRGGSWFYAPGVCRPAYRYGYTPEYRVFNLGFRVAAVQE